MPMLGSALLALSSVCSVGTASEQWHAAGQARWRELRVLDSERTIGFTRLEPPETGVTFTNVLADTSSAANRVLENGSGVAVGDFDNDDRPDIFLCSLTGNNALFRNVGGWRFLDNTKESGLEKLGVSSRGAVFADLDGDGASDLLISTLRDGVLTFFNDGHGRFTPRPGSLGSQTNRGSMTMALSDVDGNGTLDLYVANYRSDDIRDRSRIDVRRVNGQLSPAPWLRDRLELTKNGLFEFGEPDSLYLNDGRGVFRQVSWTEGGFLDVNGKALASPPRDWGLTAAFRDLTGDGLPDIYVCNDYWTPDRIWINSGQGQFKAIPLLAIRHTSENSMGVDFADIDGDGHTDFFVLDMLSRDPATRKRQVLAQAMTATPNPDSASRPQVMRNTLFRNRGDNTFEEIADFSGVPASDWSWQPVFIDVDLDGYEDVIIPAGHRRDVQDLDATAQIRSLQRPWPSNMDPKAHQEAFTLQMLEHSRLYPTLEMPIIAFRNLGNLQFEEVTDQWGTAQPGVHQGIALGDFDGDGDLDFVVNNLNSVCGVYRNDSTAPRVAVKLRGLPPNTQGIGARVTLANGAVASQTQEMACGGRYLSGFQPQLTFACGPTGRSMNLRVQWRNGSTAVVEGVMPNRLYEITEAPISGPAARSPVQFEGRPSPTGPWFQTNTGLAHVHIDVSFDDFARQPLLPRKLSQLGPGVAVFDLNGDGTDDLVIGAGRGGRPGIFLGNGRGQFASATNVAPVCTRDQTGLVAMRNAGEAVLLAGSSNYEDGLAAGASVRRIYPDAKDMDALPGTPSSTGPLALADVDQDGDLDLFVGGRVVPGRYPEPAISRLFRRDKGTWRLDTENAESLQNAGLVTGAVWSDLNGDSYPELVLACEWGPIRVFKNEKGRLREVTRELGLAEFTGLWNGVTAGDFNNDGKPDIVAGNWGLNSPYRASASQPLQLYHGDFMDRGVVDIIETEFDAPRHATAPFRRFDVMAASLPFLRERFATFRQFSESTIEAVLASLKPPSSVLKATTLGSTLFLNRGDQFVPHLLPREAQLTPVFGMCVADFDGDANEDLFLAQNFFAVQPELPPQDAGRGLLLLGNGSGAFHAIPGQISGIAVYGEQRGAAAADFDADGRTDLVLAQNRAETMVFLNKHARPGLRIRLHGPKGNPHGIGAALRLKIGDRLGPVREIRAGSGYWSQDSPVQVIAMPASARSSATVSSNNSMPDKDFDRVSKPNVEGILVVRWPNGATTTNTVPASASEVAVSFSGELTINGRSAD